MTVTVRGKREEGSTTVAHYIYWFLRILGYDVAVEANNYESDVITENHFDAKRITEKKMVIVKTESYKE